MAKKIWGGKKITEIIQDAKEKQDNLGSLFSESEETVSKIKDVAEEINQVSETISTNAKNVKNILSETEDSKNEIQRLKEETTQLKSSTDELVNTNKELLDQAKEQLAVIAGGSLSNTFEKRRGILEKSARKWFLWLIGDILALVGVATIVFIELSATQSINTGFFLKSSLSFPFIYAAFFFHGQYKRERELEEEYAFKSTISFSLEAYRKLLDGEIDDERPAERAQLLNFIVDTVEKLYSPPRISTRSREKETETPNTLKEVREIIKDVASITGKS